MRPITLFTAVLLACLRFTDAQTLQRKANLDFSVSKLSDQPGASVTRVAEASTAFKAGLRKGDIILTVNNTNVPNENSLYSTLWSIRAKEPIMLTILRGNEITPRTIKFVADEAPFESYKTLDLEPIVLTNNSGDPIRGFVTKPKSGRGKLPAILFVSWLSCGTVELPERDDSWTKMLRQVAEESGCLMLRVEKPGVGDSKGPDCSNCDLLTELDSYKAAWRYLKQRPDVDTTNIIVFGASLGGTLASIVGQGQPVKAYISAVSVYKTWLEHMIELERRRLQYTRNSQDKINELMPKFIEFHTDYLVYKKTPEQIMIEKPHLAKLWYDEPRHQYGRPADFYIQTQQLNFMESWAKITAPVYVVAGEYDWIMSLDDSKLMTEMINSKKPGQATLYIAKGMDHHWSVYANPQDAFDERNGVYAKETVTELIHWIKKTLSQ